MRFCRMSFAPIALLCSVTASAQEVSKPADWRMNHPPHYTVTDLGTLGGTFSWATGINQRGWVSGFSNVLGDADQHAFLWRDGVMIDLGTFGGPNSGAGFWGRRPNERGQVAGAAQTGTPDPAGEDFCAFFNSFFNEPPVALGCLPFIWEEGVMTPLATLERNGGASQINNGGLVVGEVDGKPDCPAGTPHPRPVVWKDGTLYELPLLAGTLYGGPNAVNDGGQAVGVLVNDCAATVNNAVLWERGRVIYLGSLGGTALGEGVSINDEGQVVGFASLAGDAVFHGFFWSKSTGMKDLGTLPGDLSSIATGINSSGQIVGGSCPDAGCASTRAFLSDHEAIVDLNTLALGSNLSLVWAFDINSRGQIVGLGFDPNTQQFHAYLANPCEDEYVNTCLDGNLEKPELSSQASAIALPETILERLTGRFGRRASVPAR